MLNPEDQTKFGKQEGRRYTYIMRRDWNLLKYYQLFNPKSTLWPNYEHHPEEIK
jgi:hypothetical protein